MGEDTKKGFLGGDHHRIVHLESRNDLGHFNELCDPTEPELFTF